LLTEVDEVAEDVIADEAEIEVEVVEDEEMDEAEEDGGETQALEDM
jgi:hypothetical protein